MIFYVQLEKCACIRSIKNKCVVDQHLINNEIYFVFILNCNEFEINDCGVFLEVKV